MSQGGREPGSPRCGPHRRAGN